MRLPVDRTWIAIQLGVLLAAFIMPPAAQAATEWQIRPFIGLAFKGSTTLVDPERAAGTTNVVLGASVGLLGEIVGIEGDLGHAPGFFQSGDQELVASSRVTTLTGNVIVGPPRSQTEYSLRPYFVGGFGLMSMHTNDAFSVELTVNRPAMNVGGGVTGALSDRIGLSWELRYFRSVTGDAIPGSLAPVQLSFWRANMALVIRY
jgi:hypothetical protein